MNLSKSSDSSDSPECYEVLGSALVTRSSHRLTLSTLPRNASASTFARCHRFPVPSNFKIAFARVFVFPPPPIDSSKGLARSGNASPDSVNQSRNGVSR
jgi:hypothetical protein